MSRSDKSRAAGWSHSMALSHLPPKSPSVSSTSNLAPPYPGCVRVPSYNSATRGEHRRSPSASFVPDVEPSWLEELLDSPKATERRVSHRRSASDSLAFLEVPSNLRRIDDIAEEDEGDSLLSYDREEQLASMFSDMNPFHANDPRGVIYGNVEGWSHHMRPYHSNLAGKGRVCLDGELQQHEQGDLSGHQGGDQNSDTKRSKRQSAQRSRVRKLQYIHELEGKVSDLENEVSALSQQVGLLEHQRLTLHFDNASLKQSVAALAQERRLKDAHGEALMKEVHRLQERLQQQQQQRLRQQLALASSATTYSAEGKHMRRASAGSVQDIGSASDVLDSFVKFVEKTDTPVLRSSCTLAGNGKSLEVGGSRLAGGAPSLPPGFIVQNQ